MKIIDKLLGIFDSNISSTAIKVVDELFLTKEEKLKFEADQIEDSFEMAINLAEKSHEARQLILDEKKEENAHEYRMETLGVQNTENARQREVSITNSSNSSKFQREFHLYISTAVLIVYLILILYPTFFPVNNVTLYEKNSESLKIIVLTIFSFFIGSSVGSRSKDKLLSEQKQNE